MRQLTVDEMREIQGEGGTWCGIGVGALVASSMLYGMLAFALVVNKTALLCGLEPWI